MMLIIQLLDNSEYCVKFDIICMLQIDDAFSGILYFLSFLFVLPI